MTSSLRIADVAARVGISTATVRYYERIGVLPSPGRADNGYRIYDERTVERLEFITRTKQLGCSLDEIADLVTAWDGGECGPIQDRLRGLVAEKLYAAQTEVVELVTLVAELRGAAAALERHRPVGPCDAECGCLGVTTEPAPSFPVALVDKPAGDDHPHPIACTLSAEQVPDRIDEWRRLIGADRVRDTSAIPGGIRLDFVDDVDVAEVARLAMAEQGCCSFFEFRIAIDRQGTALEVTGPDDALPVVHALFGAPA